MNGPDGQPAGDRGSWRRLARGFARGWRWPRLRAPGRDGAAGAFLTCVPGCREFVEDSGALEAAIPDAAALVFACLGIALALHGRRALRARALNLASVGTSVFMNAIAAEPGWRNLAIWALPPVAYALASDTLIGVVRAWALARHQHPAYEAATPLAILGGLLLWLLRLALAPAPTLAGFRAWVLAECPVAPGRRPAPAPHPRKATKTARFLDLVTERHGPLASVPLDRVAGISADLAPQLDLNTGAARTALRKAVLAARNGGLR